MSVLLYSFAEGHQPSLKAAAAAEVFTAAKINSVLSV